MTIVKKHIFTFVGVIFFSMKVLGQTTAENFVRSGNQKENQKDYKGALADFNKALEIEPGNVDALYYRGYIKFQLQDYASAIADYDAAAEKDSVDAEIFYGRGNAKFDLKNYKGAIEDYNKAIYLDPTDVDSYYNRAIAKYKTGERESACKDLMMAKKLGDKTAEDVMRELCD